MAYCPKCGAELPEGTRFCPRCGAEAGGGGAQPAAAAPKGPRAPHVAGALVVVALAAVGAMFALRLGPFAAPATDAGHEWLIGTWEGTFVGTDVWAQGSCYGAQGQPPRITVTDFDAGSGAGHADVAFLLHDHGAPDDDERSDPADRWYEESGVPVRVDERGRLGATIVVEGNGVSTTVTLAGTLAEEGRSDDFVITRSRSDEQFDINDTFSLARR